MSLAGGILLWAESGPDTGLGHVVRTSAVARALLAAGASPVVALADERAAGLVGEHGLECLRVPDLPAALRATRPGSLWVDGRPDYSKALASSTASFTVLVENETAAREHADRLLVPALHFRPDDWMRAHPERVLGGAEWIPLRPELAALRRDEEPTTDLLVTFGGSDPLGQTERILGALVRLGYKGRVEVLLGVHMEGRRPGLEALAGELPAARVAAWQAEPGESMRASRVAATALGTTLYELAYLGVGALILANYAGDRPALEHYAREGPHHPLGVSGDLDEAELDLRLAAGLERLSFEPPAPILSLAGGAARSAALLLEGGAAPEAARRPRS